MFVVILGTRHGNLEIGNSKSSLLVSWLLGFEGCYGNQAEFYKACEAESLIKLELDLDSVEIRQKVQYKINRQRV